MFTVHYSKTPFAIRIVTRCRTICDIKSTKNVGICIKIAALISAMGLQFVDDGQLFHCLKLFIDVFFF